MNLQTIGKGVMLASVAGLAASNTFLPSDDDTRNTLIALFGRTLLLGSLSTSIYELRNAFQHRHVAPMQFEGYKAALFLLPTIYFAFSPQSPIPSGESLEAYAKIVILAVSFTNFISSPTVPPPIFVDDEHEDYEPPPPSPIDPEGTLQKQSDEKSKVFCRVINIDPANQDPETRQFASDSEKVLRENIGNPENVRERLGQLINRLQIGTTADDIPGALRSLKEQLLIAEQYLDALKKADRQKLADYKPFFAELGVPFMSFIIGSMVLARITKPSEPNGEIEYSEADYQAKDQGENFARLAQASHHLLVAFSAYDRALSATFLAEGLVNITEATDKNATEAPPEETTELQFITLCDGAHVITGLYEENPFRMLREHFNPKDQDQAGSAFNEFILVAQDAAKEARKLADDFNGARDPKIKKTMDTIATFSERLVKHVENAGNAEGGLTKSGYKKVTADSAIAETGTGDKESKKEA